MRIPIDRVQTGPASGRPPGRLAGGFAALGLALAIALPVPAAEIEGVPFAESAAVAGQPLELVGLGLLRYRVVFRGYVAGLYLPADTPTEAVLEDVPKRLEISYFWSIDASDIAEAGEELVRRNVTPERYEALGARIQAINALYRDVEPGDRYALSYALDYGTELALNGEVLGRIPGVDFATAYFAIWLGDDPIDAPLRTQLLSER